MLVDVCSFILFYKKRTAYELRISEWSSDVCSSDLVYIALHKPAGVTCTTDTQIKGNIIDFVGHKQRIFPIGRLDKESEGLIQLTSNGDKIGRSSCWERVWQHV